nr:7-deoxyloganetic acid glucosyltransferase-like [Tanacetum cinerariifolium]
FVGEAWKLGLDMKDTCDRVIVEKTVRELMEDRKDEFGSQQIRWRNLQNSA